jgi:signal peptidase I
VGSANLYSYPTFTEVAESNRPSKPKSRDIVVIRKDGTFLVKRVMAVAGDVIEGKDGAIIVNGSRLEGAALDDSKANSSRL